MRRVMPHWMCAAWTLAALVLGPAAASAAQPALSAVDPCGIQRGTEVEFLLRGARLNDTEEILFYSPGLEVKNLEVVNANQVKITLAADAECRVGIHAMRIRTASGLTNLRTFSVGVLPETQEQEPNNEFAEPQAIELDCTVNGVVTNEDVDYFVVEAKAGDRITAELEGLRLGNTFFDPYLAILNEDRFELSRSDDAAFLRQDSLCSIIAPEDGRYLIQVRECAYGGDGNSKYRLHVGRFPRPTAVLPAGGRPGEELEVRWIGDAGGEWTETVRLPADELTGLLPSDEGGVAPSPNRVRIVDLDNHLEAEPNNGVAEATPVVAPGAFNGVLDEPGDIDFYRFAATKGQVLDIRVYARNVLRSPVDSVLSVHRADGGGIASNDDTNGPDSYVRFTAPDDGEYLVAIRDHLQAGGPNFVYRIEVAPVEPRLTMTLPEVARYVATTLSVPRGNRMALMVNASRADFGGELHVGVEGMPGGLSLQTVPMSGSTVPVLFTADNEAELAGALADLVGRPASGSPDITGHLNQRTLLVRGQNNRDVWGHNADRMALAITEAIPFTIEIVQPQVPIVRTGSMSLRVRAVRNEGFDAPIAIRFLYNPPGIGSSGSIQIAQGETEAVIPVTANGNAAIGKWPLIVIGTANAGNGNVQAASQMAELEIADSFFNFTFEKAAAEQGQQTEVLVNVEVKRPFEGEASVQLLGLPANTSTDSNPVALTPESDSAVFSVQVAPEARPGTFRSLVCRAIIVQNGESITQTTGGGELRVDEPLPEPTMPEPQPEVQTPEPQEPQPRRLSRLEQLRQQRERERNAGGGDQSPPDERP